MSDRTFSPNPNPNPNPDPNPNQVSDRTFNLNVNHIKGPVKGIVNGDKNGLFELDPMCARLRVRVRVRVRVW